MSITRLSNPRRISSIGIAAAAGSYGINADAASWRDRVVANGGSVSANTIAAVNTFCNAIELAGIRDRFVRLNLFCGTGLNAALVPLYRATSVGGTVVGNSTDTNNGPFVSGDYTETGSSGGLFPGASNNTKFLATGIAQNVLTSASRHLAAYEIAQSSGTFRVLAGSDNGISSNPWLLTTFNTASTMRYLSHTNASGNAVNALSPTYSGGGGLWIGTGTATDGVLYRNGSSVATSSGTAATPGSELNNVFAMSRTGSASDFTNARLGGYSIGLGLTASQALAYYNAMQAFQTALGRNV